MNVQDFISNLAPPASPAKFRVMIPYGNADESRLLQFSCFSASLPSMGFTPVEHKHHGIGLTSSIPNNKTQTEATFSFRLSEDHRERKYFMRWNSEIMSNDTYRFNFYKDYVKDIVVEQLGVGGSVTAGIKLYECWPQMISEVAYDWGQADSLTVFSVIFRCYKQEYTDGHDINVMNTPIRREDIQWETDAPSVLYKRDSQTGLFTKDDGILL